MTHNERVLALLSDGLPHSHHELYGLYVVAHSRVSDLRRQGYGIRQWRDGGDYLYQLTSSPIPSSNVEGPRAGPNDGDGRAKEADPVQDPQQTSLFDMSFRPNGRTVREILDGVGRGAYQETA